MKRILAISLLLSIAATATAQTPKVVEKPATKSTVAVVPQKPAPGTKADPAKVKVVVAPVAKTVAVPAKPAVVAVKPAVVSAKPAVVAAAQSKPAKAVAVVPAKTNAAVPAHAPAATTKVAAVPV